MDTYRQHMDIHRYHRRDTLALLLFPHHMVSVGVHWMSVGVQRTYVGVHMVSVGVHRVDMNRVSIGCVSMRP